MSDHQQEIEPGIVALGATEGRAEGEVIFNVTLSPKTQEYGDADDLSSAAETSLVETSLIKTELDDSLSLSFHSASSQVKNTPPGSKRSSKRKRKNRRRREKKAAAASPDILAADGAAAAVSPSADDSTGTETEISQNSEDIKRGDESENESETTCLETDRSYEMSSMCVEPSLTKHTIPEEDLFDVDAASPSFESTIMDSAEVMQDIGEGTSTGTNEGPTHSVETLLQIAMTKIMSQMMDPLYESIKENAVNKSPSGLRDDDSSSKLVVPPCSPSSIHSISNVGHSTETSLRVSEGSPKSRVKNVHFDEHRPEVISMEVCRNEESVFKGNTVPTTTSSSKDTVILVENVGVTESATSSIASETSAASLLKGNGSSNEDFAESSCHYPSRETVDESYEENSFEINTDSFRETIQIFKIQNPMETQHIGEEVDLILTKSVNKLSALLEKSFPNDTSPILGARESLADADEKQKTEDGHEEPNSDTIGVGHSSVGNLSSSLYDEQQEDNLESVQLPNETVKEVELDSLNASINTTFIIEKAMDQSENQTPLRPLSAEIMPRAIPDTVSDTESVAATVGNLSTVCELDENEDEISSTTLVVQDNESMQFDVLSNTASGASCCTVIETAAIIHKRPETPETVIAMDIPRPETGEAMTGPSCAVSETESAAEEMYKEVANLEAIKEKEFSVTIPSSASSTKSSISSPRSLDLNENRYEPVEDTIPVETLSHPSTSTSFESGQTESETEIEKKVRTEEKKSVEVFTLHFPSTTDAPPSENNLDSGNGDQPYFDKNALTNIFPTVPQSNDISNKNDIGHEKNDRMFAGRETETDSDYPWRPERKISLQQVIHEKEVIEDAASMEVHTGSRGAGPSGARRNLVAEQQARDNEENANDDKDDQGCGCARMCVIM